MAGGVARVAANELLLAVQQYVLHRAAVRKLRLSVPDSELHRDVADARRHHGLPAGLPVVQRVYSRKSDQQPHFGREAKWDHGGTEQLQAGIRAVDSLRSDCASG